MMACPLARRLLLHVCVLFVGAVGLPRAQGAEGLALSAVEGRPVTKVIPAPREVKASPGPLLLTDAARVVLLPGNSPEDAFAAQLLCDGLGLRLARQEKADLAQRGVIYLGVPPEIPELTRICDTLDLWPDEELGDQGYLLRVTPERAIIAANARPGVFYGAQTLLQLVEQRRGERKILGVEVRDWPALAYRGIMNDISRGQMPKVETFKRMIRTLARFKVNLFCPYIEDTFAFEKHPKIGADRASLSGREYRDLCRYAARHHMSVVPQFEAMGHQDRLLGIPEYKGLAETTGWSFAPANEGTYELLGDLMGEMIDAFPGSEFFGIGCDEVYDMGKGQSANMMEELGPAGLFAYHIERVNDILAERGRRPMMWGDMALHHPEAADLLPKDVIIMDWHYGAASHYPSVEFFKKAGFDVFTCPAISSWARVFPDYVNALDNIEVFVREGQQQEVMGAMTCNWGDNGAENLIGTLWYGFVFAAECSWNAQPRVNRSAFDRAFGRRMYGMRTGRITRAIKLLTDTNRLPGGGDSGFCFRVFHEDPFATGGTTASKEAAQQLREGAAAVMALLDQAAQEGGDTHDIPYLRFAARRIDYVGRKLIEMPRAAGEYRKSMAAADQPEVAADHLRTALRLIAGLRQELNDLRAEFARLWRAENREPKLDFNLARYDRQLAPYDNKLEEMQGALAKLENTGDAAAVEGLPVPGPASARAIKPEKGEVALPQPITSPEAYRVAVRLEANGKERTDLPIHLALDFQELLGGAVQFDPNSVRVLFDGKELPSQFVPAGENDAAGELVWIALGAIGAEEARVFEILFDTVKEDGATAPEYATDLTVTDADSGGKWIENSKYRILLGTEGAHFYVWQVKALGGLDVTQPGGSGWHGFNDVHGARHTGFQIEPIGVGPVVASFRAQGLWGSEEIIHFYAGLPYVETLTDQGVTQYWNYDNTAVMAGDSATPGTARFSDGTEASVPKSSERVHLTAGGNQRAEWSAKFREDGFTLGLVTPVEPTLQMVGPGGGWGGIGIEHSNPCRHFVLFADVAPDTWRAVARIADTLSLQRPVRAVISEVEPPRS